MNRRVLSVALVLTVVVAGCSSPGQVDGPVLTSHRQSVFAPTGGMGAIVAGTLEFDEEADCLHLTLDDVRYAVVWPFGASWNPDTPAVVIDGQSIEPGMSVSGGGGYLQHAHVEELESRAVADAASRCVGPTGEIAFFNIESEVVLTSE